MSLRSKLRDIILQEFSSTLDTDDTTNSFTAPPAAAAAAGNDIDEADHTTNPKSLPAAVVVPTVLTRNPKAVLSLDPQQLSSMLVQTRHQNHHQQQHSDHQCQSQNLPLDTVNVKSRSIVRPQNPQDDNSHQVNSNNSAIHYNSKIQRLRREIANIIATDEIVGHSSIMKNFDLNCSESSFVTGGFTLSQAIKQQQQEKDFQYYHGGSSSSDIMRHDPDIPLKISTGSTSLDRLLTSHEGHSTGKYKNEIDFDSELPLQKTMTKKQKVMHGVDRTNVETRQSMAVGISWKTITQVSGPCSSGKTQLGLTLAVNTMIMMLDQVMNKRNKDTNLENVDVTRKRDYRVYYIASGSGNRDGHGLVPLARRLRHLVSTIESKAELSSTARQQILDGIMLDSARDGYELLARLQYFEQELHDRVEDYCNRRQKNVGNDNAQDEQLGMLLVLDSISGCLSPLIYAEGDGGVGAALLNEIHLILRRISRFSNGRCFQKYGIAVFVTNGMASDFKGGKKPALGDVWRAADIHVFLEPGRDISVVGQNIVGTNDLKKVVMKSVYATLHKDGSRKNRMNGADDEYNGNYEEVMRVVPSRVEFGIGAAGIVDL